MVIKLIIIAIIVALIVMLTWFSYEIGDILKDMRRDEKRRHR